MQGVERHDNGLKVAVTPYQCVESAGSAAVVSPGKNNGTPIWVEDRPQSNGSVDDYGG